MALYGDHEGGEALHVGGVMNYYNEFDPFAAAWLREMIRAGLIPQGEVDERSITEVSADELKDYTQCHFFAGIGGWSLALHLAGWPATRPVWTGSCPCQPFSTAGRQSGKNDERHLWPVWFNLIRQCRPPVIFGEQVASAIAHGWLDDVYQGLETEGYAIGSAVLPACSVGAPHKRDRLWFVADASNNGAGSDSGETSGQGRQSLATEPESLRQNNGPGCSGRFDARSAVLNRVANAIHAGPQGHAGNGEDGDQPGRIAEKQNGSAWAGGVWIDCPDGKQRLVEPGIRLLAHGVPNRVGKLRGYGNAIVPQAAASFIEAFLETTRPVCVEECPFV